MKVKKYKLPCKVDSIHVGFDCGSDAGDMSCKVLIARLCNGSFRVLEYKYS